MSESVTVNKCVHFFRMLRGGVLSGNVNIVAYSLPVQDKSRLAFASQGLYKFFFEFQAHICEPNSDM